MPHNIAYVRRTKCLRVAWQSDVILIEWPLRLGPWFLRRIPMVGTSLGSTCAEATPKHHILVSHLLELPLNIMRSSESWSKTLRKALSLWRALHSLRLVIGPIAHRPCNQSNIFLPASDFFGIKALRKSLYSQNLFLRLPDLDFSDFQLHSFQQPQLL